VIIYTRELSKQVTEGHVRTAFIAYSVDEGARLTLSYGSGISFATSFLHLHTQYARTLLHHPYHLL
jgi:hypothetical protein